VTSKSAPSAVAQVPTSLNQPIASMLILINAGLPAAYFVGMHWRRGLAQQAYDANDGVTIAKEFDIRDPEENRVRRCCVFVCRGVRRP
jgi:hypothetical protein